MKCVICNKVISESESLNHYKTHEKFEENPKVFFVLSLLKKEEPVNEIYEKMLEKFKLKSQKSNMSFFKSIVDYYDNFELPSIQLNREHKECLNKRAPAKRIPVKKAEIKAPVKKAEIKAPVKKAEIKKAPVKKVSLKKVKAMSDEDLEIKEADDLIWQLLQDDEMEKKNKAIEEKSDEKLLLKLLKEDEQKKSPIIRKRAIPTIQPAKKRAEIKLLGDLTKKSPKLTAKEIRSQPPASLKDLQKHKPKIAAPKLKTFGISEIKSAPAPAKLTKIPKILKSPQSISPKLQKQREETAAEPAQSILSFMQMKNPKPSKIMNAPLLKKLKQYNSIPPPIEFYEPNGKKYLEDKLYENFAKLYDSSDVVFFFNQFLIFNKKAIDDFRNKEGVDDNIWHYLINEMRVYVIYIRMNTALRIKYSKDSISEEKVNNMLSKESGDIQKAAIKYFDSKRKSVTNPKESDLFQCLEKHAPAAMNAFKSEIKKQQEPPSPKEVEQLYKNFDKQKRDYYEFNSMYTKMQEYDPASILLEPRILKLARLGMPDYDIAFILAADIEIIRNELNIIALIDYVKNHPKDAAAFTVDELLTMFTIIPSETVHQRISFYKEL